MPKYHRRTPPKSSDQIRQAIANANRNRSAKIARDIYNANPPPVLDESWSGNLTLDAVDAAVAIVVEQIEGVNRERRNLPIHRKLDDGERTDAYWATQLLCYMVKRGLAPQRAQFSGQAVESVCMSGWIFDRIEERSGFVVRRGEIERRRAGQA